MISIDIIRDRTDEVRKSIESRGDSIDLDLVIELDTSRRASITDADNLRAIRKKGSQQLASMEAKPTKLIDDMRNIGSRIKVLESQIRSTDEQLNNLLLTIPNLPQENVPLGEDDSSNVVTQTGGQFRSFDFTPLHHWDLGQRLDIIDFRRGAKVSGSRFYTLVGKGAKLQRALINWLLDLHSSERGYNELYLPYMVNRETVIGSGQLPKFRDNMYNDHEDDLWLIPTAEVPITNLHGNEILSSDQLPINYVAHTPCFRREKAAAGKETRGIKRLNQFEKVELYKIVDPEHSDSELDNLLADAVNVCVQLKIPYQVKLLCSADLGFTSSLTYDVEIWAPGSQDWLEVSSCSNCTDFQARRANIRFRSEPGARPKFVHTLNGSGLGIPRTLIAILENYQREDGSIIIPEVLLPYTGFERI